MIYFTQVGDDVQITREGEQFTVATAEVKENCCTNNVYLRFTDTTKNFSIGYGDEVSINGAEPISGVDTIGSALSDLFATEDVGGGEGGVQLDEANIFTENQQVKKNSTGTAQVWAENLNPEGSASATAIVGSEGIDISIYGANNEDAEFAGLAVLTGFGSEGLLIQNLTSGKPLTIKSAGPVVIHNVQEYADDAAAAVGSVPVGGLYRTASVLKIRVS